ncbi:hypothetical protein JCM6882_009748 [Rhodosporidiobolus microsporus]
MAAPPPAHRPLPHFSSPHRPSRAPLPPTSTPLSHSSRPARKESLKREGRPSQGIAMDGRGAYLEAALENRRLMGVPVLKERQADGALAAGADGGGADALADAYAGEVGTWEDEEENGRRREEKEVLRDRGGGPVPPPHPPTAPTGGAVGLSRMTSTRRYMQELDPDEEDDDDDADLEALQEQDEEEDDAEGDARSTWYSGYGGEGRESVVTVGAPPVGRGGERGRLGVPSENLMSAMTVGSVNDPFSYSMYESLPSPIDPAFPSAASEPLPPHPSSHPHRPPPLPSHASVSSGPVVRIGPPSPTTEAYLQNPHDSTLWNEVTAAAGASPEYLSRSVPPQAPLAPPAAPALSASQPAGRIRSQTLSGLKNFSRPFAPPSVTTPPSSPPQHFAPPSAPHAHPSAANRSNSGDSYNPSLGRQDSLGYNSSVERSSSLGHSSSVGHSSQGGHSMSSSWEDRQKHGFRQHEEAKRAIALARSKSQRAVAERHGRREVEDEHGVEELRDDEEDERIVPVVPTAFQAPPVVGGHSTNESTSASIHFAPLSPPAAPHSATTGHFSLSYYAADPSSSYGNGEDDAQYATVPSALGESSHQYSPLANPRAPPPAPPSTFSASSSVGSLPIPIPVSPPTTSSSNHAFSPTPSLSSTSPRQRNVLRKARPPPPPPPVPGEGSQAMARSLSGASTTSNGSSGGGVGGAWSRFRARSKSRSGADQRPDPASLRPPLPAISAPLLVSDPPHAFSPPSTSTSSPPESTSTPLASSSSTLLPPPGPDSAPLSQAEFARLAALRPAFPRSRTEATDWVLKSVAGARTVQAGLVAEAGVAAKGWTLKDGAEEVEQLSEAGSPSKQRFAAAPGMARSYSDTGPATAPFFAPAHAAAGQHDRAPSAVPSLYSQYSYYDLGPDSPLLPPGSAGGSRQASPLPSPGLGGAVKFADSAAQGSAAGAAPNRASTTMEKLGVVAKQARGERPPVERTPSGKEVRKEPVSPDDFLQLGIDLHESGELERSAWCFEQSARRNGGCGAGMLMYGLTLRHGWGCQVNAQLGFRYLQMAAESVVEDLDRVVFGGRTLSEKEANTKSAKNELVLALYEMGISYRFGWGVVKDKKMAVSYLKLAAELGDVDAQQDVAFMFANGKGVKKDLKSAARFYRMAIAQGASDFGLSWVRKAKYD